MLTSNPTQPTFIPALESGDRLTRTEFERRYRLHPAIKKAELIEGVVYVASPVRIKRHAEPHGDLITWLGVYKASTPGVTLGDNATVRLDLDNEPQPDGLLRLEEACGGQSRISEDDYIEGAPELVAEIAASSASYDLHDKLNSYRRNGVQEYLVWLVEDREFRWYELQEGQFVEQSSNVNEMFESKVFPGLRLAVAALLAGDMATVLAELQKGIDTDAHRQFAVALAEKRGDG